MKMLTFFLTVQYRIEAGVTTIAYSAAAISLLADVFGREILGQGVWGASRFAVYAAIIAGFLGLSLAAADDAHIRPRLFDFLISNRYEPLINRSADLLSAILYAALGSLAVSFVWVTFENGDRAAVLDWPIWPIQCVLPYAFLSVAFRYLMQAIDPVLKQRLLVARVAPE